MTGEEIITSGAPGAAAFALCELEWMRRRVLSQLACEQLSTFVDNVGDGFGEVGEDVIRRVRSEIEDVEEFVMSAVHGLSAIEVRDVNATAGEVEAAAAAALVDGIADIERALHAARWIGVRVGLLALRVMLESGDAYRLWEVPVVRFVAAFRDVDLELARSITTSADLGEMSFSELTDEQILRLAAVLGEAGGGVR